MKPQSTPDAAHLSMFRMRGKNGQCYVLNRVIGHGPFSTVYHCIDESDPSHPAYSCKVTQKDLLMRYSRTNLVREVSILHSIQHDNIVPLHDLLETDDFVCLIFPYMEGGELFDKIAARKRFTEADAREVLIQIASGLEYLHSHGICHRDIKPENILCTGEEEHFRVAISSFELAAFYGKGEIMTSSCGTLHYVAPEVIAHNGPYTEACDIWSFGVVAYVLFTGCFPFSGQYNRLACNIARGMYNRAKLRMCGVSQEACAFIDRLLCLNPAERPTASELLKNDPWLNASNTPVSDLTESSSHLPSLNCDFETDDEMDDDLSDD